MKTLHARIVGLCPSLDGAKVEVMPDPLEGGFVIRSNYVPTHTVVRFNGFPVTVGALVLEHHYLEWIPDLSAEELGEDNPFGSYIDSEKWANGDAMVTATLYEFAAQFNIRMMNTGRTLYDRAFFNEQGVKMWDRLRDTMMIPGMEPMDFLFELLEETKI